MRIPSSILGLVGMATLASACTGRSLVLDAGSDATSDLAISDVRNDIRDGANDAPPSDIVVVDVVDTADAPLVDTVDAVRDDAPDAADATADDAPDVVIDAAIDAPLDATDDVFTGGWTPLGSGSCNARQRAVPVQDAIHVDFDASITWLTNPPSSGPHYSIWAHWGTFPEIPPGYWVHNLEHSGVVFLHSCVAGSESCDEIVAALSAAVDTIPDDPVCMPSDADPTRVRVVVTHYEPLDTQIAGAAWGWLYAADCVDPESMRLFYAQHAGMTYENFCADGYYP